MAGGKSHGGCLAQGPGENIRVQLLSVSVHVVTIVRVIYSFMFRPMKLIGPLDKC
jgi:hypothetical protein